MTKTIVLTMLAAVGIATAGSASEGSVATDLNFEVGVTGTYSTQDIWRGQNQGDNDVRLEATTDLDFIGLPAFATLALSDNDLQEELELTVGSAYELDIPFIGEVTAFADLNYYSEGTDVVGDVTFELGVGVAKSFSFGTVTLSQFIALDGDNDGYGELSVDLGEGVYGIKTVASVGYLLEDTKFTHVELVATLPDLPVQILDTSFTPFIKGVHTFDGRGGIWAEDGFEFVGGISLSRSF